MAIIIDGNSLSLADFVKVARGREPVELSSAALERVILSRRVLMELIATGKPVYGVNTGFGALATRSIPAGDLLKLQKNLVRSHCAGFGPPLSREVTRGLMLLRANVLAKGYSGVRPEVIRLIIEMLNRDLVPVIPGKGSVGASGDLAPLSHLALALIGEGEIEINGKRIKSSRVLKKNGLEPLCLAEKEGLALINGTQMMTSQAIFNLSAAQNLVMTADIAGAITLEAQLGSPSPFFSEIHQVRRHPGQAVTAANILQIIKDSPLWVSHQGKTRVQDAYSLRCMPQVHGAVRDTLGFVEKTLETEANSATENPLVFPEKGIILSGGNFHGEPVALAMDYLAIAVAELGSISERRLDRLVNPACNGGLPAFLATRSGLNSGFMIAQVTASALASENKVLAHPASVDSIPTSANQEDHVSMGAHAARKAAEIIENVSGILAIEILAGLQALDFYSLPSSPVIENIKSQIRDFVPFIKKDTRLDSHIEAITDFIRRGKLAAAARTYNCQIQ